MAKDADTLARAFAGICLKAAIEVMEVYESAFAVQSKDDHSPVTAADTRAEAVILAALSGVLPGVPVLAEESFPAGRCLDTAGDFLLVDPVDGTREFISRNGEFTINIAFVSGREPVAGCVYAPALKRLYLGGTQAWLGLAAPGTALDSAGLAPIRARAMPATGRVGLVSRSRADSDARAFLEREGIIQPVSAGSSLKFGLIAQGEADLYARFGPTMEWDIAAGHAVLRAAGGEVTCPEGRPLLYGKSDQNYLNGPFVARGR